MKKLSPEVMFAGLQRLGVHQGFFHAVQTARTLDAAMELLRGAQATAKKEFRKLAMELHPDRNGGDQQKTEEFMHLTEVLRQFEDLTIQPMQAVQPRVVIRFYNGGPSVTSTSASTTAGWGGWPY